MFEEVTIENNKNEFECLPDILCPSSMTECIFRQSCHYEYHSYNFIWRHMQQIQLLPFIWLFWWSLYYLLKKHYSDVMLKIKQIKVLFCLSKCSLFCQLYRRLVHSFTFLFSNVLSFLPSYIRYKIKSKYILKHSIDNPSQ